MIAIVSIEFWFYVLRWDYVLCFSEYLQRMLLYRQKIWTCKYTGKTNCTYEEALACEDQALEKMKEVC